MLPLRPEAGAGRFADIQVAKGSLNVWLPRNLNANLTAKVLHTGKITNNYKLMKTNA